MLSRSVHSIFYFILGGKPLDSVSEEREEEKEAWVFFFWWEVWGQSMCRVLFANCFHCTGSFPFRKNNKIQATEWNGNSSWMELCSSVVMDLGEKATGWIRSGTVLPLVTAPLSWVYMPKPYCQGLVQCEVHYLGLSLCLLCTLILLFQGIN